MTRLSQQTQAQIDKGRQAKPAFMQTVDELLATAKQNGAGSAALQVGAKVPAFELPDAQGRSVALSHLLERGPAVLTFYRGGWCPYCNLQLHAMQQRLAEIHDLGAELVAISPQRPDESLPQTERESLAFVVLSDQDALLARQVGVAWEVPAFLLEHMAQDRGLDLSKINNGNGHVLPIPATFIVSQDGVVVWRYVDADYRTRAEPDDILAELKKLHDASA